MDTRQRLLAAGLKLARRQGLKALTVRALATEADVNLGSFVHHYGTRDAFIAELIERWYAPVFAQLQLAAAAELPPLQALREALLQFLAWLVKHRSFIAQLVLDASAGEPAARRFMATLDQRHPAVLLRLIVRAQAAGALRRDEPMHQLLFLMSAMAVPVLMFHLLARQKLAPNALVQAVTRYTTEPEAIQQRLGWALQGLAPAAEASR
jgi:AcrR family transcriptional regulator